MGRDSEMAEIGRALEEHRKQERREKLAAAAVEYRDLAKLCCSGDLTLRAPAVTHWTVSRSRGKEVVVQYWPSAEKAMLQGEKRSRRCTLQQFRDILIEKLGCPPTRG